MAKDKMKMDPEKFAYAVVNSYCPDEKDDVKASKMILKRFLAAYYLADEFNGLEAEQFSMFKDVDFKRMSQAMENININ
ncbi:hypothetical protein [Companilactobacillus baiquanensis]|uniref:Uncharacterized protein n=1 Tax=Companilactobacillus baiquanensis TaxID=2486005 RepID=A0ABW1UWW2_9LACO|nr:hypothetical protein [Companilactobacillus baiquanensis]